MVYVHAGLRHPPESHPDILLSGVEEAANCWTKVEVKRKEKKSPESYQTRPNCHCGIRTLLDALLGKWRKIFCLLFLGNSTGPSAILLMRKTFH